MYLYEEAIINDINKLFTNSKVRAVIADSISEGLRRVAAEKEDKITLPAVILTGGAWSINDVNFYSLMHGSEEKRIFEEDGKSYSKNSNILPITPHYNFNILAKSSRECDMLTREILFHYFMYPTLIITVPYGLDEIKTFNLLFGHDVSKTQTSNGLVYRTVSFDLQGAYLWHNNTFNVVQKLETEVRSEVEDKI